MKKVLLFVLAIALVSTLTASIGCSGKKSTSSTAPTSAAATVSTKTP